MEKSRYVIKKYIMAKDISEAIRLDRKTKVEEAWIDPDWIKLQDEKSKNQIGFK